MRARVPRATPIPIPAFAPVLRLSEEEEEFCACAPLEEPDAGVDEAGLAEEVVNVADLLVTVEDEDEDEADEELLLLLLLAIAVLDVGDPDPGINVSLAIAATPDERTVRSSGAGAWKT
jgi:hypothetical protein